MVVGLNQLVWSAADFASGQGELRSGGRLLAGWPVLVAAFHGSIVRLKLETRKPFVYGPSPVVSSSTHCETGEGGSRRMIESRPSIFGTHDGDGML